MFQPIEALKSGLSFENHGINDPLKRGFQDLGEGFKPFLVGWKIPHETNNDSTVRKSDKEEAGWRSDCDG